MQPAAQRAGRAGKDGVCVTFASVRETGMLRIIEQKAGIKFKRAGPPQVSRCLGLLTIRVYHMGHIIRWAAVVRSIGRVSLPFIATFSRAVREEGRDCGSRRCACMRTRRRPQHIVAGRSDPPICNGYCTAAAAVRSEVCACVRAGVGCGQGGEERHYRIARAAAPR